MVKYIKTAATEFEQFDEAEWDRKYKSCQHPEDWQQLAGRLNIDRHMGQFIIQSREGDMRLHDGDWIATGVNGERWAVTDEIFKQTYQALPAIPEGVALYISDLKSGLSDMGENVNLAEAIIAAVDYDQASDVIVDWIKAHGNEFARAWLDGYEIDNKS